MLWTGSRLLNSFLADVEAAHSFRPIPSFHYLLRLYVRLRQPSSLYAICCRVLQSIPLVLFARVLHAGPRIQPIVILVHIV